MRLRSRLMLFFTLILIIPTTIVLNTTLKYSTEIIQNEASVLVANTVSQISMSIDEMLQGSVVNVSRFLLHDSRIHQILTREYNSGKDDNFRAKLLDELDLSNKILQQYTATYNDIYIAALYGKNGQIYNISFAKQDEAILRNEIRKVENIVKKNNYSNKVKFLSLQPNDFSSSKTSDIRQDNVILAESRIFDFSTTQYKGLCIFTISERAIYTKYKDIKIGQTGTVFVINEYGELISHMNEDVLKYGKIDKNLANKALSNKDKSFFIEQDGEVFLGFARTSYLTGWTTVGIVPVNELTAKMGRVKFAVYGITFLAILVTLIAAVFISNTITNPIKNVIKSMEKFREGNFDARIEVTGDYEISRLAEFFNLTVERIQQLILKEYELEKKKKEAELYVLQAQINPHFLYNTLESIVWKARSIGADDICYMASALGKLFRLAVNKGGPIVKVREEIEHVKAYVKIQNLRYGGKIKLTINVDNACILEYKTLKLILQPVVENAIYHGLEKTGREGAINIEVYVKNDCLEFVIADNGMGMSRDALDMLKRKIASGEDSEVREKRGIGLINIHERIELYFGEGYGIKVSCSEGSGTTVKITTPMLI